MNSRSTAAIIPSRLQSHGVPAERRVLVDLEQDPPSAGREVSQIEAEVEQLLEIYGKSGSFEG